MLFVFRIGPVTKALGLQRPMGVRDYLAVIELHPAPWGHRLHILIWGQAGIRMTHKVPGDIFLVNLKFSIGSNHQRGQVRAPNNTLPRSMVVETPDGRVVS